MLTALTLSLWALHCPTHSHTRIHFSWSHILFDSLFFLCFRRDWREINNSHDTKYGRTQVGVLVRERFSRANLVLSISVFCYIYLWINYSSIIGQSAYVFDSKKLKPDLKCKMRRCWRWRCWQDMHVDLIHHQQIPVRLCAHHFRQLRRHRPRQRRARHIVLVRHGRPGRLW